MFSKHLCSIHVNWWGVPCRTKIKHKRDGFLWKLPNPRSKLMLWRCLLRIRLSQLMRSSWRQNLFFNLSTNMIFHLLKPTFGVEHPRADLSRWHGNASTSKAANKSQNFRYEKRLKIIETIVCQRKLNFAAFKLLETKIFFLKILTFEKILKSMISSKPAMPLKFKFFSKIIFSTLYHHRTNGL